MTTAGISEVNIGAIRNLGFNIVKRRSEKTTAKTNGVVMNFDADTGFADVKATESVAEEFKNENTKVVVLGIDWVAEESDNPDYIENMQRMVLNTEHMELMYFYGNQEITWGSPRTAVRISALNELGGIPELAKGEDFELTQRMITHHRKSNSIQMRPDLVVQTTFRSREDNPDGFDSKEIHSKFHTDTELDPIKNLYDTIWDRWFSGKAALLKQQGEPAHEAAIIMSSYIKTLIEEDEITDEFETLEKLDDYEQIDNWLYDMTTKEDSLFPARTGPVSVPVAIGFILNKNISEKEYLDVGLSLDDTTFRISKVLLRAINIFLQEAVVTNNLPDTKAVIDTITRNKSVYNDN